MLFIAIGLIIFLISFLLALILLVRELGQRVNIDDSLSDFSLDFADVESTSSSDTADLINFSPSDEPINSGLQDDVSSPPSLDEIVPFPWEAEAEMQLNDQAGQIRVLREGESSEVSPPLEVNYELGSSSFDIAQRDSDSNRMGHPIEIVSTKPVKGLSPDNLNGGFWVKDLAEKIE